MAVYKIELRGTGLQAGIGAISKASYSFWNGRDDILEATDPNSDFSFDDIGIDEGSDLTLYDFWDYTSALSFSGLGLMPEVNILLTVLDENRDVVYEIDLCDLAAERMAKDEYYEFAEEQDEFYSRVSTPNHSDLVTGAYLYWYRSGTGKWFTGTVEQDQFNIEDLEFDGVDFEGDNYLISVKYKGQQLMNDDYDIGWNDQTINLIQSTNQNGLKAIWRYELY